MKSIEVFKGISQSGIDHAIKNAVENAKNATQFEVIEMTSSRDNQTHRHYKATLKSVETADTES